MLAIKLKRIGKKHQAYFRLIAIEKRSKLQGRCVEDLGWLNPHNKTYKLSNEKIKHWLKFGAQPTDTVYNLLVKTGIIKGRKRPVHLSKKTKTPEVKTQNIEEKKADKEQTKKEEADKEEVRT